MYVDIRTNRYSRKDPFQTLYFAGSIRQSSANIYRIKIHEYDLLELKRKCRRYRYELLRKYPENYGRSDDYRMTFFKANERPKAGYHCRYCNKYLLDDLITIDHIYPVYKAKRGKGRFWMMLFGIKNVNDPKNLAPSCKLCNLKKGRKTGLWVIRGYLGKFRVYWFLKNLFYIILGVMFCFFLYSYFFDMAVC